MISNLAIRAALNLIVAAIAAMPVLSAAAENDSTSPRNVKPSIALVYAKQYDINLGGLERAHPFDIHKYSKIAAELVQQKVVELDDFHKPTELQPADILRVHTPAYLENLKDPQKVAGYLEAPTAALLPAQVLDLGMLRAFRYASGGTILAARLAPKHGIAVNLGGGYHHAKPDRGEGFCIYADMPIAIRVLQSEKAIARALVVDLDVHRGNGTIVCCRNDDKVFTFSMHQGNIYPMPKEKGDLDIELESGTNDETYLRTLRGQLPQAFAQAKPDIVFLQAGCDPLQGDPLASLALTPQGIVARDAQVVDFCVKRQVPVVITLGGGYSKDAWKVQYGSVLSLIERYGIARRNTEPKALTADDQDN